MNKSMSARHSEDGIGMYSPLLFLVLIALIVAVFMKALTVWLAIGLFVLAIIVIGLLASLPDIQRYIKISNM